MAADASDLRERFSSEPRSHCSRSSRSGHARLTHCPTFAGWFAPDIGVDKVQCGDAAQRFGRQRRWPRHVQAVELAARVRPPYCFFHTTTFVQGAQAGVCVSLQYALELGQVRLRMDALAVWRIGEPDCRWCEATGWPVVPHVGPQTIGFGFSIARREHRHGRIIGVQFNCRQQVLADRVEQ